jgi:hypothetical protein
MISSYHLQQQIIRIAPSDSSWLRLATLRTLPSLRLRTEVRWAWLQLRLLRLPTHTWHSDWCAPRIGEGFEDQSPKSTSEDKAASVTTAFRLLSCRSATMRFMWRWHTSGNHSLPQLWNTSGDPSANLCFTGELYTTPRRRKKCS